MKKIKSVLVLTALLGVVACSDTEHDVNVQHSGEVEYVNKAFEKERYKPDSKKEAIEAIEEIAEEEAKLEEYKAWTAKQTDPRKIQGGKDHIERQKRLIASLKKLQSQ